MSNRRNSELGIADLAIYLRKYWMWIVVVGILGTFGSYLKFNQAHFYTATSSFSIVSGESNRMQELTEKLSGANFSSYDAVTRTSKKYFRYFNSNTKGKLIYSLLENSDNLGVVYDLQIAHKSFVEQIYDILGFSRLVSKNKLRIFSETFGVGGIYYHFFSYNQVLPKDELIKNKSLMERLINQSISVTVSPDDPSVIVIQAKAVTAESAASLANLAMQTGSQYVVQQDLEEVEASRSYLHKQIGKARTRVQEIERSIANIKKNNASGYKATKKFHSQLTNLENQLLDAETEKAQIVELIRNTKNKISGADGSYNVLERKRLDHLEKQKVFYQSKVTSIQVLIARLTEDQQDLDKMQVTVDAQIDNYEKEKDFEYRSIASLQQHLFEMNVMEVSTKNSVRVINRAEASTAIKPRFKIELVISAFLLSGLLMGLLIILKESISPEINSREDVEHYGFMDFGSVPDINILSNLSRVTFRRKNGKFDSAEKNNLPFFIPANTPMDYVFGQIRSRLLHSLQVSEYDLKVVAMTSPKQGEGKSMVSGKLAFSLAKAKYRTLIVDGDLIRKDISLQLNRDEDPGLREVLNGELDISEAIQPVEECENLYVLCAGRDRGSASDLLITRQGFDFMSYCRENFDIVIVDTPALLIAPDALLLCRLSDVSTLVLSGGQTKLLDVKKAERDLTNNGIERIGCVMNRTESLLRYVYHHPKKKDSSGTGGRPNKAKSMGIAKPKLKKDADDEYAKAFAAEMKAVSEKINSDEIEDQNDDQSSLKDKKKKTG